MELDIVVGEIRHLNTSIKRREGVRRDQGSTPPGWRNVTSIKGSGDTGVSTTIGTIGDFADEGNLAAYFGIVPRVRNSKETERSGRITKRGCKVGRTTRPDGGTVQPPPTRVLSPVPRARGNGKAIIAMVGKFLGIRYKTLKNNWIWEDFPRFVLANG
jgi:transposase